MFPAKELLAAIAPPIQLKIRKEPHNPPALGAERPARHGREGVFGCSFLHSSFEGVHTTDEDIANKIVTVHECLT